jgi:lycopene cyclase domain-containing protein
MYYFSILFFVVALAVFIEWFFKEHLFRSLKARFLCAFIALVSITIWDLYAIPNRHWIFTGRGITGIYIGPIPIEEFFWALFVPFLWVTIYRAVHIIFDKRKTKKKLCQN